MQTGNEQFVQRLHEFLETAKGSRYDKAAVIYDLIMESEIPQAAFAYFLENADYIGSSDEKEVDAYFTAQQLKKCEIEYAALIDAILNRLVLRHYEKEKFYSELWEDIIKDDGFFDEKDAKIYAIGRIWFDARVPYFCVKDGIKMSNEDFADIIDYRKELLQEANFILSCRYEQRTESSSLLLDILERCNNDKEKAVVLARILDLVESRVMINILKNQVTVQ